MVIADKEQRRALLYILRNPQGWNEETIRDARCKAADELSRLWDMERSIQAVAGDLNYIVNPPKTEAS